MGEKILFGLWAPQAVVAGTDLRQGREQWIVVEGRPETPVRNLHFVGIDFSYTARARPAFGYNGIQAGHYGTTMKEPTYVLPVAIEISFARDCSITDSRIAHTGAGGIGFGAGTRHNS